MRAALFRWGLACASLSLMAGGCTPIPPVASHEESGVKGSNDDSSDADGGQAEPGADDGRRGRSETGGHGGGDEEPQDDEAGRGSAGTGGRKTTAGTGAAHSDNAAGGGDGSEPRGGHGGDSDGSGPRSGGATPPAAGSGADAPSWYCMQVGSLCTCIDNPQDITGDSCAKPKPTCCFTFDTLGTHACNCAPPDSNECTKEPAELENAEPVTTCPPP